MKRSALAITALLAAGTGTLAAAQTLTIASVNNPDMVTMQELSSTFEEQNPDITLEWLFLDEGTLRSRLTTDVATGSGSFDVVTVGAYETPLWAANDWIVSVDALAEEYPEAAEGYNLTTSCPLSPPLTPMRANSTRCPFMASRALPCTTKNCSTTRV